MRSANILRLAQSEIVASARRAGMAAIATTVLHNVGNSLNSVNVPADRPHAHLFPRLRPAWLRPGGHGDMGGTSRAPSDGRDRGATFTLELPPRATETA